MSMDTPYTTAREVAIPTKYQPTMAQSWRLMTLANWLDDNAGSLLAPRIDSNSLSDQPFYMGHYTSGDLEDVDLWDDLCGSSGCAIGWATHALEPRIMTEEDGLESYYQFATRLFGVNDKDMEAGAFMFGSVWADDEGQNTAKATAERIRYVAEHSGAVPHSWGEIWRHGRWDHDRIYHLQTETAERIEAALRAFEEGA